MKETMHQYVIEGKTGCFENRKKIWAYLQDHGY